LIEGLVINGRPYVAASVSVPRLGRRRLVTFLVDTGADVTVIHAQDQAALGIDAARDLSVRSSIQLGGIGGTSTPFVENCEFRFIHEDGVRQTLSVPAYFPVLTVVNEPYESLLGRDVLENFRLTFEQRAGLLVLEEPHGLPVIA